MKKGLNVTLMTVAFAMLCMQAMAMAPVISDIQSPVIGNEPGATAATPYYWKDAIDLDANVSDDTTADADILWSYSIVGTPIYRLNNVDPINPSTDNPNAPGAKRLDTGTTDPNEGDANGNTVTIRNVKYAPVSGTGATPSGSGLIDQQVVTLFASDSTTYSSKDIMFYTEVGGSDHFGTGGGATDIPTATLPTGWTFNTASSFGGITSAVVSGGICQSVALTGNNFNTDGWKSDFGFVPLVQNAVYKMRFKMTFAATGSATAPFWDIVINNYNGTNGLNLYGGDFYFLDNEGSANAPTSGGKDFFVWWAPSPVSTTAWNDASTGVFASSVGNNKNCFLQFRLLDVNAQGGITADLDAGQVCMTQIQLQRWDISQMTVGASAYSNTALASGNYFGAGLLGSTVTYASGACTVANVSGSQAAELVQTYPGDATLNIASPDSYLDNFPIPWVSNKLYMVTVELSAPTAGDQSNPYDVFWVGMDTGTNEVLTESYVTTKQNLCGMPKTGTPQVYREFFWSHTASNTTVNQFKRLRPKVNFGNAPGLVDVTNSGATRIHSMKVDEVTFPGM